MTAISGRFRFNRLQRFALRAGEVALIALVAKGVVGIPLHDALLPEQRAAILTVFADFAGDRSGTAKSNANRHIDTLLGAPDR
jgi:hypothetical protein